ncbi:MAG: diaminopimelate epimerase, partial [Sediminibacterium sp.]
MEIQFSKYQGTGNDFVIIDNRDGSIALSNKQIAFLCDRKFGVGSDGLIMLGTANDYDFSMAYYNADGTEGTMCGNGGRCLVQYANDHGIVKENYLF